MEPKGYCRTEVRSTLKSENFEDKKVSEPLNRRGPKGAPENPDSRDKRSKEY